jgi:outer membrane receptor for ferrienterochelin and colicin
MPSAVTVITREQIRDHAWHTLADLLDAVPGLAIPAEEFERRWQAERVEA